MAVICCPDCKREMSDTASACPNCGYPYAQKKEVYRKAVELMKNCTTSDGYLGVAELFHAIPEFQDAENLEKECRKRAGAYYQKEKQREEQERQEKLRQEHERKAKQEQERLRQEQERIRKEQELKQRQEKEEKEQLERIKRQEEFLNKHKVHLAICAVSLIIVVATYYFVTYFVIPNVKYLNAVEMQNSGEYEAAIVAFEELSGYKDSNEQIDACETAIKDLAYNSAITLMNDGRYGEAIDAFKKLDGYKDSNEQIDACETAIKDLAYNSAIALMKNGDYEKAIEEFQKLGHYKDSESLITESATALALSYETNGDSQKAIFWYESVGNTEKVNALMYDYVLSNQNSEDVTTYDYLTKLTAEGYRDSSSIYSKLYKFDITLSFDNYELCYIITGGPPKGNVAVRIVNEAYWSNGYRSNYEVAEDYTFTSPVELEGIEQRREVSTWYSYRHTITAYNGISGQKLAQIVDPYE